MRRFYKLIVIFLFIFQNYYLPCKEDIITYEEFIKTNQIKIGTKIGNFINYKNIDINKLPVFL